MSAKEAERYNAYTLQQGFDYSFFLFSFLFSFLFLLLHLSASEKGGETRKYLG